MNDTQTYTQHTHALLMQVVGSHLMQFMQKDKHVHMYTQNIIARLRNIHAWMHRIPYPYIWDYAHAHAHMHLYHTHADTINTRMHDDTHGCNDHAYTQSRTHRLAHTHTHTNMSSESNCTQLSESCAGKVGDKVGRAQAGTKRLVDKNRYTQTRALSQSRLARQAVHTHTPHLHTQHRHAINAHRHVIDAHTHTCNSALTHVAHTRTNHSRSTAASYGAPK
eukprot:GDKI01006139.1.p1 GENE.GDKI01006139.1~~GDKI01006139.1.p1  ORF type:complete len:221 (+),score=55.86 GDKI01006139.1:147-809(+)